MQRQTRQIISKTVAGLMAVWLSGFVFLFCCGDTAKAEPKAEFCPMHKPAHHCDTGTEQKNDYDAFSRVKGICIDCCGFLPVVFDKARKVDRPHQSVAAPERVAVAERRITPRLTRTTEIISHYRARFPDKSRTFISTQVFRI